MDIVPLHEGTHEIRPILAYRKVNDRWEPWTINPGNLYTAAMLACGRCGNIISGMGGPGGENWLCPKCYQQEISANSKT
jgi:hypothetical protein